MKVREKKETLRVGDLHKRLLISFAEDMRSVLGDDFLDDEPKPWLDLRSYRLNTKPMPLHADRYRYKARYQYKTYLKRFTFSDDVVTAEVRQLLAFDAFRKTQCRIADPCFLGKQLRQTTYLVLQKARQIIKSILGKYDSVEHGKLCYFGKRASVDVPYRDSYLDVKAGLLSSSLQIDRWFYKQHLKTDVLLSEACREAFSQSDELGRITRSLQLAAVPKRWDTDRTILKNTTLGAFYTGGLGKYMVQCLKAVGYDLNRRARRHAEWIMRYSISRSHVTGDLTTASDSYYSALMRRLFPYDWYKAMNLGRITSCEVSDGTITMASFMTMGIGFTFPAQTIAFYAILRAISELTGIQGNISVFGDDLIYPREMHRYVLSVFEDVGFLLNKDKTFVNEYFRESCGSDYYAGLDVRPFQPQGEDLVLSGDAALSYLYKVCNGWLQRWDAVEIPRVHSLLLTECLRFTALWHQVPDFYPVTSGIRTKNPNTDPDSLWCKPTYYNGTFYFSCLSEKRHLRYVPVQLVYLWDHLRKTEGDSPADYPWERVEDTTDLVWYSTKPTRDRKFLGCRYTHYKPNSLCAGVARKGVKHRYAVTSECTPYWYTTNKTLIKN